MFYVSPFSPREGVEELSVFSLQEFIQVMLRYVAIPSLTVEWARISQARDAHISTCINYIPALGGSCPYDGVCLLHLELSATWFVD